MDYCNRVKADLAETGVVVKVGKNPILKMPVLISGNQGTVYIDEIPIVAAPVVVDIAGTGGGGDGKQINMRVFDNTRTLGGDQMRNYILQLHAIMSLRRENIELRTEFERRFDVLLSQFVERGFAPVNGNIRRVAMQPVRRRVTTATGIDLLAGAATTGTVGAATELAPALAMMNPPKLMPRSPKSLFDLWDEYINGVGGRKPARHFLEPAERGRVKYKYTSWKVVWDVIKTLVDLGHTSSLLHAIDMIYNVHGAQTSLTTIINRMR
jgi:hypothetical protein